MSQTGLAKIADPSHVAAGARFARRAKQILAMREAGYAREDAECVARFEKLLEETKGEQPPTNGGSAESSEVR